MQPNRNHGTARTIWDKLHLLGVVVDRFVDDHDIALGLAVLEARRGVHADVDHTLGHFLIQLLRNFFRAEIIPAALDGAGIVDDTGFAACKRRICGLMQQLDREENTRTDQQDEENNRVDGDVLRARFTRDVNVFFFGFHRENSFVY